MSTDDADGDLAATGQVVVITVAGLCVSQEARPRVLSYVESQFEWIPIDVPSGHEKLLVARDDRAVKPSRKQGPLPAVSSVEK